MNNHSTHGQLDASWRPACRVEEDVARRPARVFVMDLLSIVPYYTGHLCAQLKDVDSIQVAFGSIQYGHDEAFFERIGVRTDPGLLDLSRHLPEFLAPVRRLLKAGEYVLNLGLLAVRFMARTPDILHVQFLPLVKQGIPVEIWFLSLARALGIRIVYTVHNVLPHERHQRDKQLYQRIYHLADRFICHDVHAANRLVSEFQVAPERISLIPHGPLFQSSGKADAAEARRRLGLPHEDCIVLFQGIIRSYKGVSFLLKAWKRALEAGFQGTLLIVGKGDDDLLSGIRREVATLAIESSVRLVFRFVSVEELDRYYKAADILTYPYGAVTTSGALMTGIGYGKAIIATALPAFQELLRHEENALLVGYGHVEGFADTLLRLGQSEQLRNRLARQLQITNTNLPTWSEIARQTARCYATALAEPPAWKRDRNPSAAGTLQRKDAE